jgi:ketosteroid isomerase-like protein
VKRTLLLLLAIALPLYAEVAEKNPAPKDPVEEVRQTEIAFAKAFADRDSDKFFSYVADDAHFLSDLRTLEGKGQVVSAWSHFFSRPAAPFSWGPERVSVTGDGKTAISTGPVYDPNGTLIGVYTSIWRKEKDGSWKIIFDRGGNVAPLPENVLPSEKGVLDTADGAHLAYRTIGEGPLTIIAANDAVLYDQLKQFADVAKVVTYDRRASSTPEKDLADLDAIVQKFSGKTFVAIAYGDSTEVMESYAIAHPERIMRLIQIGGNADIDSIKLTAPVLVIGDATTTALPNARVITIKGGGDKPWATSPATVFAAMRAFMRGDWPLGAVK